MNLVDAMKAMIDGTKVYNVTAEKEHYIYFNDTERRFKYVDLVDKREAEALGILYPEKYGTFSFYKEKPKLETKVEYHVFDMKYGIKSEIFNSYEEAEDFTRKNTGKFKIEKIVTTEKVK